MKNIIITVLSVLVVGLSCFIIFDKVINKEEKKEDNIVENNTTEEEKKEDNIVENNTTEEKNDTEDDEYVLTNPVFSDINNDNFIALKITRDGYKGTATITDSNYADAYELLKALSNQTYNKTKTTGIGVGEYEVDVLYKNNGKTVNMKITDEMVFGIFEDGYVYSISSSEAIKSNIKDIVISLFNKYGN